MRVRNIQYAKWLNISRSTQVRIHFERFNDFKCVCVLEMSLLYYKKWECFNMTTLGSHMFE